MCRYVLLNNKNIEPRVSWDGDFTWDGHFLRMHIETVTPGYNINNPITWPLIRKVIATGTQADHSKTTVPPQWLVYDQKLVRGFKRLQNTQGKSIETSQYMRNLFLHYPFNYDRYGKLRDHPHITPDELEEWKKQMSCVVRTRKQEAVTKNATTNDHTNDEATKNTSSEAAMNEIMKMLGSEADTDIIPYTRVVELEEELEKTRKQVSEANKRVGIAEQAKDRQHVAYQAACKTYSTRVSDEVYELRKYWTNLLSQERTNLGNAKELLVLMKEAMDQEKTRADTAERDIEALRTDLAGCSNDLKESKKEAEELKAEVKQSNKDISAANQKAAVAEQQILKILEEMKTKKQSAGSQKRKSSEDVSGAERKRLKTEV
ncbi:unnamed protein product [Alternaria burnsii]|nr:unnamed protein product [Alternaria burnsii]